ncbi:hypothetical protein Tco_0762119 [Tanacetum coccineum]
MNSTHPSGADPKPKRTLMVLPQPKRTRCGDSVKPTHPFVVLLKPHAPYGATVDPNAPLGDGEATVTVMGEWLSDRDGGGGSVDMVKMKMASIEW